MLNRLVWKIGGEAGYGIMLTGRIFSKTCLRSGLNVYGYAEYPSLVRGGYNVYTVRVSDEEVYSPVERVNVLVALNKDTIDKSQKYLVKGGVLIYDSNEVKGGVEFRKDIEIVAVPMQELIKKIAGIKIMRNIVSLGATMALVGAGLEELNGTIASAFSEKHKAKEIVEKNLKAAKIGYDYVRIKYKKGFSFKLKKIVGKEKKIILDGNQAITFGALKAGCKFYAAYPMTPATSILHNLAAREKEYNLVVKQTEDEIAAINMTTGAGYAGVRSMCATSGGGFCLMTEGLGLAGITETPIVVVNAQRPGPSTGLPTRTGQSDLRFMIHASQGEFPRVVVSPGDVDECFYETFNAFNLAEKYQLPVLLLTDKFLVAGYKSTKVFDTTKMRVVREGFANKLGPGFLRYKFSSDGVSPRSVPGEKGGIFIATGNEHNEYGHITENPENRVKMVDKRAQKLKSAMKDIPEPKLYGVNGADITLVSFGSLKGPILDAMRVLKKEGIKVNFLHYVYVYPLRVRKLMRVLGRAKNVLLIEQNSMAQFGSLLKEFALVDISEKLLKYDGRQILPSEICERVRGILK